MTLRRLGRSAKDLSAFTAERKSETANLLREIKRLNDYLALMTNETSPPTEHDDTDATT